MGSFFKILFIVSLFFIQNATAAGLGNLTTPVKEFLRARAAYLGIGKKSHMRESLHELEERLWGESLGDISDFDIEQLMEFGFNPKEIIEELENVRKEVQLAPSPVVLPHEGEAIIARICTKVFAYINSPIFLRWWSQERFRKYTFHLIRKDDFQANSELLLKWWRESKVREQFDGEDMESYIRSSFEEIMRKYSSEEIFFSQVLHEDPFLRTVFRAIKRDRNFADEVKPIFGELFKEFNIDPLRSLLKAQGADITSYCRCSSKYLLA